jgi:uncharacterized protein
MEFEWDPVKAAANLAKHGIDFADAVCVFGDPKMVSIRDLRGYGEMRHRAIGTVEGRVLLVVYTMCDGEVCRIINARRASRRERNAYTPPARS